MKFYWWKYMIYSIYCGSIIVLLCRHSKSNKTAVPPHLENLLLELSFMKFSVAMVVSFSDVIPLGNKILGVCHLEPMRWYNAPFPLLDVVVSETRSETSEVILLNVTHLHICPATMRNPLTMKICFIPMTFQEMKFRFSSSELYFLGVSFFQIFLYHIKKVNCG